MTSRLHHIDHINHIHCSILYGSLLGDAYAYPGGCIEFRQSSIHREYIEWLYTTLKNITPDTGLKLATQYDRRTKRSYISYRFYTRAWFHDLRTLFYPDGVKRLPKTFARDIDETALAIWFLDDGARASQTERAVYFTMDSFTLDEIQHIQQVFREKFSFETTLQKAGVSKNNTPQRRLRVGVSQYPHFYSLVYPIVSQIPSMMEKKLPIPLKK
jgi:hypothetical protein